MRAVEQLGLVGLVKQAELGEYTGDRAPGGMAWLGMQAAGVASQMPSRMAAKFVMTPNADLLMSGASESAQMAGDKGMTRAEMVELLGRTQGHDVRYNEGRVGPAYVPKWMGKSTLGLATGQHGAVLQPTGQPTHIDMMLHELGHAKVHSGESAALRTLGKARVGGQLGMILSGGLAPTALLFPRLSHKHKDQALDAASVVGGVGAAPVLADEFLASRHALKRMDSLHGEGKLQQFLLKEMNNYPALRVLAKKRLMLAGSTYGLAAAGAVGLPQVAKHIMHSRDKRVKPLRWWQDR